MTSRNRHQPLVRWAHALWAIAVLVDLALGFLCLSGIIWSGLGYELRVHAVIGLIILGAFLIYVPYRFQRPAPDYDNGPIPFAGLVEFVHRGLTISAILVAATGILTLWQAGTLGLALGLGEAGSPAPAALFALAHGLLVYILAALVLAHIGGVVFHIAVLRDQTHMRMWPPWSR
jgi:cytochrome b561